MLFTDLVNTKLNHWRIFLCALIGYSNLGYAVLFTSKQNKTNASYQKNGIRFAATTNKEISQLNYTVVEKHEEGNKNKLLVWQFLQVALSV